MRIVRRVEDVPRDLGEASLIVGLGGQVGGHGGVIRFTGKSGLPSMYVIGPSVPPALGRPSQRADLVFRALRLTDGIGDGRRIEARDLGLPQSKQVDNQEREDCGGLAQFPSHAS